MVTFRTSDSRPILGRGPAPGLRFFFYGALCVGIMWLDQRDNYLAQIRHGLSMVTYPVQVVVDSPGSFFGWLSDSFSTRATLRTENAALTRQLRDANLKLMRFDALEQENLRLREMRAATAGIAEHVVIAEIMRVDADPLRQRVIINKGTRDGAFRQQPLLDATGIFGQITRAGAFSSEVILISDTEAQIPVQVNRNGLRTIAVGTGDPSRLSLPFLAANADIREGDLLVSSGLAGVFPAGYPVGTVTSIRSVGTMAEIVAKPAAALDRDREVLMVWVKNEVPSEPATDPAAAAHGPTPTPAPTAAKPEAPKP